METSNSSNSRSSPSRPSKSHKPLRGARLFKMADAAEYQTRLRHSLLDLARGLQSGGNADTVDFAIFRLQQINRHLVQSDRFNEVLHCISAVTVLLESVEEFGTNHGPRATSVPSGAAGRPKFDIPQEHLQYLIDYEISMTKIAQALGVSKSTIKRRVRDNGISVGPRVVLDDSELDTLVRDI